MSLPEHIDRWLTEQTAAARRQYEQVLRYAELRRAGLQVFHDDPAEQGEWVTAEGGLSPAPVSMLDEEMARGEVWVDAVEDHRRTAPPATGEEPF